MRVLYFSRAYTPHDYRFLASITSTEHEVYYLRLERIQDQQDFRPLPALVHLVSSDFPEKIPTLDGILSLVPALQRVVDDVRPDLVHAGPVQSCAFLAALAGFHPLLTMSWGSDLLVDADTDELHHWATRYTLIRSDIVVTDSQEVSERASALASPVPVSIVQFPWGVDLEAFRPEGPINTAGLSSHDTFIVVSNRAWEPQYGVLTLLEGFRRALGACPTLRLILIGDGSLRVRIQSYIAENSLTPFVRMPGRLPYYLMPDYLRGAQAYVSCALSDGSSVSLMEALATGLPAILTDRPSNREWVAPEDNGWLVPFADASGLCDALLRVANMDSSARAAMRCRNRALAETRANWATNFSQLMQAYRSAAARGAMVDL